MRTFKDSINIVTPKDSTFKVGNSTASLIWSPDMGALRSKSFNKAQKYTDNAVLRLSGPFTPFDTGQLDKSGYTNTVIGSGLVVWKTPYAQRLYYNPKGSDPPFNFQKKRPYSGAYWFERMKTAHKTEILRGAAEITGAKK